MDLDSTSGDDSIVTRQLILFRAVALLHDWGYESIRALPYMSPSGMYWRMEIRALDDADNPASEDIHQQFGEGGRSIYYSSAGCEQFGDELNHEISNGRATPEQVVRAILAALPSARPHPGADPGYVDWFAQLAATAVSLGTVPIAFDDSMDDRPGWRFVGRPFLRFDEPPRVSGSLSRELTSTSGATDIPDHTAAIVSSGKAAVKAPKDETYVLDLCDQLLEPGERQKRFDWLTGDPSLTTEKKTRLPLDGYWDTFRLAIEFQEKQHFEPVPFWDQKLTASGMTRGEQRKIYDQRKVEKTAEHGVRLLHIRQDAFPMSKGKIDRDPKRDLDIVRRLLHEALGADMPAARPEV
jgi:hypothetical protein